MDDRNMRPLPEGLQDGVTYKGCIVDAMQREYESKFDPGGVRCVLSVRVRVSLDHYSTDLYHVVTWNWDPRGRFVKLLDDLGCLPEPGETFDPRSLSGLPVEVTVQNREKDGIVYSNAASLRRTGSDGNGRSPRLPLAR